MRILMCLALLACLSPPSAGGQPHGEVRRAVDRFRREHSVAWLNDFANLLRLPNVSRDADDVRRVAEHLRDQFARRGATMELLELPGANPVVYGEIAGRDTDLEIVIYAHYDGQPVNPRRWQTTTPWEPAMFSDLPSRGGRKIDWPETAQQLDPDWRLFARSASDDKLPFAALLGALDALRQSQLPVVPHVKFFFDGEEEVGSPNMARFLERYGRRWENADLWLFCDGPLHQSRRPTLYYGVRGVTGLELTVYGALRNLHSGHYGNWAPNPALRLAQLLSSMKDAHDNVVVRGFYDSVIPLSDTERQAIGRLPAPDDQLRRELGLARTENNNQSYYERLARPSLNVRGLASASVGATARNIVPREATASIDIRLVKGNLPKKMLDRVEDHIRAQGYHIVRGEPDRATRLKHARIVQVARRDGYPAARTRMDDPYVRRLAGHLESVLEQPMLHVPTIGGSLPLYLITDGLRKPLVIVPLANHDNNQHAPDENIRLGNLLDGLDIMAALLTLR